MRNFLLFNTLSLMFQGKVMIYKNINGKEHKIEKEFDNAKDYEKFIDANDVKGFDDLAMINLDPLLQLHNYFEDLIDQKLGFGFMDMDEELPAPKAKKTLPAKKSTAKAAKKPAKKTPKTKMKSKK